VLPEIATLYEDGGRAADTMRLLDLAARQDAPVGVRFAVLGRALDPLALEALANRLKLPAACRDLALLVSRHGNLIADAQELDAAELLQVLDAADAWRRPGRFAELLDAALVGEETAASARARLEKARQAAAAVNAGEIARQATTPAEIRERIDEARLAAIREALKQH
jgi:tRNA nucleotidyltransferase (CCA-adding enzyme)